MCRDALKEFLVFPRALYSFQGTVYFGSYCKQHLYLTHNSILDPTFNWNTMLYSLSIVFKQLSISLIPVYA